MRKFLESVTNGRVYPFDVFISWVVVLVVGISILTLFFALATGLT